MGRVIGDMEFGQINLGGHNATGENYSLFQSKLKFLKEMDTFSGFNQNEKSLVELYRTQINVLKLVTLFQ